jgi:hypothetical protein
MENKSLSQTNLSPGDPRSLPGRLGEIRYLSKPPSTGLIKAAIVLLYLISLAVIFFSGIAWSTVAAIPRAFLYLQSGQPETSIFPALLFLFGLIAGIIPAMPFFAIAEILRLQIHIEENTRQTKELTYYLLVGQKK